MQYVRPYKISGSFIIASLENPFNLFLIIASLSSCFDRASNGLFYLCKWLIQLYDLNSAPVVNPTYAPLTEFLENKSYSFLAISLQSISSFISSSAISSSEGIYFSRLKLFIFIFLALSCRKISGVGQKFFNL